MAAFEFLSILLIIQVTVAQDTYFSLYQIPSDCKNGRADKNHEFYDSATMSCVPCFNNITLQRSSDDRLTCVCQPGFRYKTNFGGAHVSCEKCGANQVVSTDGWECVSCDNAVNLDKDVHTCPGCTANQVQVERNINGDWIKLKTKVCQECSNDTHLNTAKDRCVRCNENLSMQPTAKSCTCADVNMADNYCFQEKDKLQGVTSTSLYNIPLETGGQVTSKYFKENIRSSDALCRVYKNMTACQRLANMCVLLLYDQGSVRTGGQPQACSLLKTALGNTEWGPSPVPSILYSDVVSSSASNVINSGDITTSYSFDPTMVMKFRLARYSLDGSFLGFSDITGGQIQLCEDRESMQDAAFVFGTVYSSSCSISAVKFWNQKKYPLEFIDIYLDYVDTGTSERRMYKIPLVISNYRDVTSRRVNDGSMANWRLTRRFFLVDNVATIVSETADNTGNAVPAAPNATVVRYVKNIQLVLSLQTGTSNGRINVPYFKITYGEVTRLAAQQGEKVQISFSVSYSMNQGSYVKNFQIATGTLGTLAVLYAVYRTWVWSKRGRRYAIDFATIINLMFYLASALANTFFIIIFGISFYWLIFYKRQNAVYLVHPAPWVIEDWLALFGSAFALKTLNIIHMIIMQCTIDIFLIDWERPKGVQDSVKNDSKSGSTPVSIWRTYFVANEWNEIQATRKLNQTFQLFAVVFFLVVVGFENVATMDPNGNVSKDADAYQSAHSFVYRFAIAVLVYLLVAAVQWVFYVFIYERFIEDPVRQFVDLCSMSNVSVFIMANAAFGYYIHGRSVHGKADTDMKEMHQMMKREEQDMCGKRGLIPDSDQQTFQITLPQRLREKYDQVFIPAAIDAAQANNAGGRLTDKSVDAYNMINRFLSAFIDNSLRDLNYTVKDKTLLESILDTEFFDMMEAEGSFYNDNGHSFDQVLFFGNELTLIIFDCLLFCMVDHIATNFVLAGIVTYLVGELIRMIRDSGGRKNLVKKTLVDERFLI